MFTKQEMNVLQQALRHWGGPYGKDQHNDLNDDEKRNEKDALELADSLARRFEEILFYYYRLENGQLIER